MVKYGTLFVVFFLCCLTTSILSQKKIQSYTVEYGLRVAYAGNLFKQKSSLLEDDVGIHFFDGFFFRVNREKISVRLGIGYFSDHSIFPYYDKPTAASKITKTNFLQ